ncbi:MAG: DUF3090 family protein [Chloroflexi bacterium]|nr:DUF3090 family protein [Chloroflexota bacterium]MDA0245324.1 DUF3090 family protein [Chloroflexota bacterium]
MARHIELNPASHVTVGTIGEPGQRVFYLQGSKTDHLITLVIEKQQAAALADSLIQLLQQLGQSVSVEPHAEGQWTADLRLREPIEVLFRVGQLGLGYSDDVQRIVILTYELVEEGIEPNMVSFWITIAQARILVPRIAALVKSGRPLCGNCGLPIDMAGHFCPNRNGHKH